MTYDKTKTVNQNLIDNGLSKINSDGTLCKDIHNGENIVFTGMISEVIAWMKNNAE